MKKTTIFVGNSAFAKVDSYFFVYLRGFLRFIGMKKFVLILGCCLCLFSCTQQEKNADLLHREFFQTVWERFDYVRNDIEVKSATTFDLSMKIVFTDDYSYDYFSMVFTVFTNEGDPYRSKGYKFNVKDSDGQWNVEKSGDGYTYILPINKALQITEPGHYTFQIENLMPITPLVGVKELILMQNN